MSFMLSDGAMGADNCRMGIGPPCLIRATVV
jgi:hypothetical protein